MNQLLSLRSSSRARSEFPPCPPCRLQFTAPPVAPSRRYMTATFNTPSLYTIYFHYANTTILRAILLNAPRNSLAGSQRGIKGTEVFPHARLRQLMLLTNSIQSQLFQVYTFRSIFVRFGASLT